MSSFSTACSWTNNSSGSLFPLYSSLIKPITDDQFNSFHNIDRKLFSCLIFSHGREAGESIQIMAFWLWLEKEGYCPMKLVYKILHELPAHLISQVADEAMLCLRCIENDHFIFSGSEVDDQHISLLQSLMEERRLSLRQLHENRITVLSKVTTIANEICCRAFKDILQPLFGASEASSSNSTNNRYTSTTIVMPPPVIGIPYYPNVNVGGVMPNQLVRFSGVPQFLANDGGGHEMTTAIEVPSHRMVVPNQMMVVRQQGVNSDFNPYEILHLQQQQQQQQIHEVVNRELEERMGHVRISEHHEAEIQQVPADDRTIFLTFSKGYPISENEVREFFTRKFGDFIEAIHMQEVPPDEQSLFARIVARTASVIDRIAPRNSKAKFSINGKHVWARKYVKKTPRQSTDAGPSQSSGPATRP